MIVGLIVAVGSAENPFVGVIQEAVTLLVICLIDRVGLVTVRVSNVVVFVLVTAFGVEVTVGWTVAEGFVTVEGGSTVVLKNVLTDVISIGKSACQTLELGFEGAY